MPNQNAILKKPAGTSNQNTTLNKLKSFPKVVFPMPSVLIAD